MQLWFQALFGISNARTLRLGDFFPSGHFDSPARISSSEWFIFHITNTALKRPKNPPRGLQFYCSGYLVSKLKRTLAWKIIRTDEIFLLSKYTVCTWDDMMNRSTKSWCFYRHLKCLLPVDGYLQWCTTFVWTSQGTDVAFDQSFIIALVVGVSIPIIFSTLWVSAV